MAPDDNDFSEEDPDLIAGTGLVVVTHNRAKRFHLYSLVKCNSVWRNRESPFDGIVLSNQFHPTCIVLCLADLWDLCGPNWSNGIGRSQVGNLSKMYPLLQLWILGMTASAQTDWFPLIWSHISPYNNSSKKFPHFFTGNKLPATPRHIFLPTRKWCWTKCVRSAIPMTSRDWSTDRRGKNEWLLPCLQ